MCEHEELNRFFRELAGQNQARDVNRTWVLRRGQCDDPTLPLVLGYYTLGLCTVTRETVPPSIVKRLPKYPIPAVIIGRLARDSRARGRGYGEILLDDAHRRALAINANAGAVLLIVDAKDEGARDFYARFGYRPLSSGASVGEWPQRMFLTMKDVRASFEEG
ncbi:GNAT family N-acetyltransferase [Myxococcus virescens]|uniref:GNAT family N-acetyltransferase n=1 Tax=Myxococcus virescens TaxID=83456 RepID=UPI003DA2A4BC